MGQCALAAAFALIIGTAWPAIADQAVTNRTTAGQAAAAPALAMHGAPALAPGFSHFPYANPDAPKGGRMVQSVLGTFDSLNPFIVSGVPVVAVRGLVVESLMARGYDEPFTLYGLLAHSVETDAARSFVTFTLEPKATFSDGKPVTAEDVAFSWKLLRDHGRPNMHSYYSKVAKVEVLDDKTIRFDLTGSDDRELPLILGLMPVLPQHVIDPEKFEQTTLGGFMGSGPYVIGDVKPGRSITFDRSPSYWGRDKAVNRGLWNFDQVRLDYYRDSNSEFEAFKKGLIDLREEKDPVRWQTGYDGPGLRAGRIVKEAMPDGLPAGMRAFVFNTRRPQFADIRVREALNLLFDFEWVNHNLFFDLYTRTDSYFANSELASTGHPADAREKQLLAPFAGAVRADILAGTWTPPKSDGSGRDRGHLRKALALFRDAGYVLRGTRLVRKDSGKPFTFEMLVRSRDQERLALAYAHDLDRAGIAVTVRMVDAVQFEQRKQSYDFDMIEYLWDESLSPGNEQEFYWSSAAARQQGSRNYMGVRSKAADAMIAALLAARERPAFVSAVRALDRVLLSGFYVVPLFHLPVQWIASSNRVAHPTKISTSGFLPETWYRRAPAGGGP